MQNHPHVNDMLVESRLKSAKAFVFDFFKTVVDTAKDVPPMWKTLTDLGYDCTLQLQAVWESDAFNGCLTPSINDDPDYQKWRRCNLEQFAEHSGVPATTIENVVSKLLEIDSQFTVKPVPYANSILRYLRKRNRRIGLCSNWDYAIQSYLDQAQLVQFDGMAVSAEVGARKPHPAIFADICSKLKVAPQDAIFIGDDWSTDIEGALRSGLTPVWIRHKNASSGSPLIAEFESLEECGVFLRNLI